MEQRFEEGDEVRVVRLAATNSAEIFLALIMRQGAPDDVWEVTRILPESGPEPQYRIKSLENGQEMVAFQSQLELANL